MKKDFRIEAAHKATGAHLAREGQFQRGEPLIQSDEHEYWHRMEDELDAKRKDDGAGAIVGMLGAVFIMGLALAGLYWAFK
jgi:hypothetical protein